MTFSTPRTVAFVDDDADLRRANAQALELAGFEVQTFSTAARALAAIDAAFPGVVVTDIRMPQMDGHKLYEKLHDLDPEIPVIFITGHGDVSQAVEAMKTGAYDFIPKPFSNDRLVRTIANALEKRRLVLDNRRLRGLAEEAQQRWPLIGQSAPMELLRKRLRQIADTDIDVLIEGETGTGKELAARAIHAASRRKAKPFVVVDCAALPAALLESELFGHELGAFAGAVRKRVGRIESANGGTLFLDGVTVLPPDSQTRLTRFLEEREVTPLGSNQPLNLDVRVIASVQLHPERATATNSLLPELYHRLNVVKLSLPSLRERREDVPLLFSHFVTRAADRFKAQPPSVSDPVRRHLEAHDWPGNVRELAHYSERFALGLEEGLESTGADAGRFGLKERVDRYEAQLIREALRAASGDVRTALEALGIPRKTFYDKVARHEIDLAQFRGGTG